MVCVISLGMHAKGFEIRGLSPDEYVLKLHKNIYGQKQAGRV
jgi:hypothetical protein